MIYGFLVGVIIALAVISIAFYDAIETLNFHTRQGQQPQVRFCKICLMNQSLLIVTISTMVGWALS